MLFLRVDREGPPLWWGMVHGEFLRWRGETVVSGR